MYLKHYNGTVASFSRKAGVKSEVAARSGLLTDQD